VPKTCIGRCKTWEAMEYTERWMFFGELPILGPLIGEKRTRVSYQCHWGVTKDAEFVSGQWTGSDDHVQVLGPLSRRGHASTRQVLSWGLRTVPAVYSAVWILHPTVGPAGFSPPKEVLSIASNAWPPHLPVPA